MIEPVSCFQALFLGLGLGLVSGSQTRQRKASETEKKKRKKKKKPPEPKESLCSYALSNELVALRRIFKDDLTEVSSFGQQNNLEVFLKPYHCSGEDVHCSVYLQVFIENEYPKKRPYVMLNKPVNLTREVLSSYEQKILKLISEKSSLEEPMIYDICDLVQSLLAEQNLEVIKALDSKDSTKTELEEKVKNEIESRSKSEELLMLNEHRDIKKIAEQLEFKSLATPEMKGFSYETSFSEEQKLGKGAFGSVYKVKNNLDGNDYAIKKIKLKHIPESERSNKKMFSEVFLLSKLQHQNIVRYYNSWIEDDESASESEPEEGSYSCLSFEDSEEEFSEDSETDENWVFGFERSEGKIDPCIWNKDQPEWNKKILYIQMEFCDGATLRTKMDESSVSSNEKWQITREILKALDYIHSKNMIHRDLKPGNIFFDERNSVKLGDFGLACAGAIKKEPVSSSSQYELGELSTGIGTPLYISPEQETSVNYDEKSDMYSLGIILFELWSKFESSMQRITEITQLRTKHQLPEDFEAPKKVQEIIFWLTEPLPENRPKAFELLQSGLLPHKIDPSKFSEFLQVVLNPENIENNQLLSKLFEQQNPLHIDFTYNMSADMQEGATLRRRKQKIENILRANVSGKVRSIFVRAGAVEIEVPIIMPFYSKSTIWQQTRKGNMVSVKVDTLGAPTFLDKSGYTVQLPTNSVAPWARMLSRTHLGGMLKRFCIQKVFRAQSKGEHPKEYLEASIDFCYDDSEANNQVLFQAELLKLTMSCFEGFSEELPLLQLSVNDSRLTDALFDYLNVPSETRLQVFQVCATIKRKKWPKVQKELEEIGLQPHIIPKLKNYFTKVGTLRTIRQEIKKQPIKTDKVLLEVLKEMKQLENKCRTFGVQFVVDLGLFSEDYIYYSGLIFKVTFQQESVRISRSVKERTTLAMGGSYNNLIKHYEYPPKPATACGVGARVYLDKLVFALLQGNYAKWIKGPLVFVTNEESDHDHINLTLLLWKEKLDTIYSYEKIAYEEILDICSRYRIRFWISLKNSGSETETKIAKVNDFAREGKKATTSVNSVIPFIHERLLRHPQEDTPLNYPQITRVTNKT